jgi:hypothetical protein
MAQKTAMQSLLTMLEMTREHSHTDMIHLPSLIDTIRTTYLHHEEENIIKAVRAGHKFCEDGFVPWMGEQYYNETYNK